MKLWKISAANFKTRGPQRCGNSFACRASHPHDVPIVGTLRFQQPLSTMKIPAFVQSAYRLFIKVADILQCPFLLAIRLYWGWQMFVSGRAHLSDIPTMVQRFQQWGVPFPTLNVYVSGFTECVCGLMLVVGIASRIVAIPLVINFCVAYLTASRETLFNIFKDPDAFVSDAAFLFLLASLIVLLFGPGRISLDWLICRKCCQPDEKGETRV